MPEFRWPLMRGNIGEDARTDAADLILRGERLTQGPKVREFEDAWCRWQGCKHSVFVSSGSMANVVTLAALAERRVGYSGGGARVLVPAVTWPSDIRAVLLAGFEPVFVDCDLDTLGMHTTSAVAKLVDDPAIAAVFLTHAFGFNALSNELYGACVNAKVTLIEDCCESVGALTRWAGRKHKVGSFGLASNFSFYYAHHLSTVEGGMVCTDDAEFAALVRMMRGHGLLRESGDERMKGEHACSYAGFLDPQFLFPVPGFNCRNTEVGAAIGIAGLPGLEEAIVDRRMNLATFLGSLDGRKYRNFYGTGAAEGSCDSHSPYGLPIVLRQPDAGLAARVEGLLAERRVECRKGVVGGGNQMRQPYLRRTYGDAYKKYPNAEHLHNFGWAIGNYPGLEEKEIIELAEALNAL